MKKTFGLGGRTVLPAVFAITVACLLDSSQARGAIIASWDFTSANASTFNYVSPTPSFTSSGGNATEGISGGTLHYAYNGANVGNLNNTVLTFTMAPNNSTISGLSVQYDAFSGQVTALSGTWAYSINGGTFANIGSASGITIGAAAGANNNTFTLSGVSIAPTDSSLVFRLTLSGAAGGNNGTLNFDNLEFDALSAVPEPINYALAVFGLVFVGGSAGRFCLGRRRLATAS